MLAKEGAKVILVGRTKEKLERVKETVDAMGGDAIVFPCNVTDEEAVGRLAEVANELGGCDFLINGAGGNNTRAMPTLTEFNDAELCGELPEDQRGIYNIDMQAFEDVLKTNTMGTVIPTLALAKQMIKKGEGSVINFASMNSYCPLTRCFAYAMSKAAIVNLTQSLAAYFGKTGVRINAVAPGFMVNERSKNYLGTVEEGLTKRGEQVIGHTPMGRFGTASDLIGCVKWLLNDEAAGFVTGATIPVDGGFLTLSGV
jgi:NAD(P)-dependent dehydrogenase (short-subunit alcohol dehydrogenase family)